MPFGPELVVRGTREGLVPTLIAMLATAVVLAPIAFAGNAAGLGDRAARWPSSVLGGLVTTTLVNLFVVPVLYLRFGFRRRSGQLDRRSVRAGIRAANHPGRRRAPASCGEFGTQPRRCRSIRRPLLLPGCGGAVADAYTIEHEPAVVATPAGSDRPAGHRRGGSSAATQPSRRTASQPAPEGVAVPSSAVFVDPDGVWWVYTNPEPLVFERHEIGLEREEGGVAYLSSGPPAGATVVTVGVPELYGVEDSSRPLSGRAERTRQ